MHISAKCTHWPHQHLQISHLVWQWHEVTQWAESHWIFVRSICLLLSSFTPSWTLSSKFFATFPNGTCLLSVSLALFSLRWGLPPTLDCTLKQPDSQEAPTATDAICTGLAPSLDCGPDQRNLKYAPVAERLSYTPHFTWHNQAIQCWAYPGSLAVTQGILVSFFSST